MRAPPQSAGPGTTAQSAHCLIRPCTEDHKVDTRLQLQIKGLPDGAVDEAKLIGLFSTDFLICKVTANRKAFFVYESSRHLRKLAHSFYEKNTDYLTSEPAPEQLI